MNNKEFDLKLREKVFEVFPWGKIITTYDYKCEVIEVSFIFYCMDETRSRYWSFSKHLIDSAGNEIIENIANEIRRLVKNAKGEKQADLAYFADQLASD